jgi:hypothetical protein
MAFENESARTLRVDVDGGVWLKPGVAIAFCSQIIAPRRLPRSGQAAWPHRAPPLETRGFPGIFANLNRARPGLELALVLATADMAPAATDSKEHRS